MADSSIFPEWIAARLVSQLSYRSGAREHNRCSEVERLLTSFETLVASKRLDTSSAITPSSIPAWRD
jgi:hypothetical protein